MNLPKTLPIAAISVASSLLLTGCFSSGARSASEGKRIRVAMMQPPRSTLSPLSDDAFKLSRWSTAETLVTLDKDGDARPALATKWRRTGDKTWTFTIRRGVEFHDGSALTAQAVVRSLNAATRAAPKPRILDGVDMKVKASGGSTVTVTTAEADPLWGSFTASFPARPNVSGRRSGAVLSWVGEDRAWASRQGCGGRRAARGPPGRSGRGRPVAKRRRPMPCCTAARSVT